MNNIEIHCVCACVAAGHTGLGGFPATRRQPVSLPGKEKGRYQDVCSPFLQGVADLERRGRKDKVPVRSEVRTGVRGNCNGGHMIDDALLL